MNFKEGVAVVTTLMGLAVILNNTVFVPPYLNTQYNTIIPSRVQGHWTLNNKQSINQSSVQGVKLNKQFKDKFSVCPVFCGRLGNKMFQFATSYGVALDKNMTVELNRNVELWRVFKLSVGVRQKGSNCNSGKIKVLKESKSASFDRRLLDFNATSSVSLRVYLQSYLYFDKHKTEIRKQFTFVDEIQSKADAIIQRCLRKHNCFNRNNITLIGIHVRRGDRARMSITDPKGGFKLATKEYMQKAVDWYKARYNNLLFLAASNGMNWTKTNMPTNIRVEYLENNTAVVDLAVLASTDHFISTLGSFSWWAGWLTGGNVTYYKWPAAEGGRYRKAFSKDFMDHYYKQWIGF